MEFRWNDWNVEHIAQHGVDPEETEDVIRQTKRPYPLGRPDGKYLVQGRGRGGRLLQVIYVLDEDKTIFVIHARPLKVREKRRYRKRKK